MPAPMEETGRGHELFVVHAAADREWVHGYLLPELGLPEGAVLTSAGFTPARRGRPRSSGA